MSSLPAEFVETKSFSDEKLPPSPTVESVSDAELSRIQRRIDWRIMPWICLTYLVMRIDINNISNAAIMNIEQKHGIKQQLHLSAQQWAWVLACFYYPYAFLEPMSTLLMKKTTPSFWIGRIMITWGIVACCISAVQNYAGLITVRTLLGAAEAGYYPCVIYYLAFWFKPEELALRIAAFFSFGQISGFVGGFLAFAISYADGRLPGWRWLFIIEGIPAILMGFATLWILPDYPQTAKFLTQRERDIIIDRMSPYAPTKSSKTWDRSQVLRLFVDPTFWTFSFTWGFHAVGAVGLSLVLPTVIFQLGFTSTALSNVLAMPPSLAAFIVLNVLGWLIQKRNWNPFRVAMGLEFVDIIACIILITVKHSTVRYLCLVVATATAGSVYPVLWPSRVRAARGTSAAGVAIGITNAVAQFQGILGPQLFTAALGPSYRVSFEGCIGLLSGSILSIAASQYLMARTDRREAADDAKSDAAFAP